MATSTLAVNENNDLYLPDGNNLLILHDLDAITQDLGSATKMRLGEDPYNTTSGIDYLGNVFAPQPQFDQFRYELSKAAMTVPDVVAVRDVQVLQEGDKVRYTLTVATVFGSLQFAG